MNTERGRKRATPVVSPAPVAAGKAASGKIRATTVAPSSPETSATAQAK